MGKKSQQGVALLWIILVGTLLITTVEMVFILQTKKQVQNIEEIRPSHPLPSYEQVEIKKEAGEKGEEFVGKIEEIITRGVPMKCTYTQEGSTGVSFIEGNKMYSEVSTDGDATTYTIIEDNCMWSWGLEENQGTKMCFEEDIWDMREVVPVEVEYRCETALFSDSQFNPPASVDFMDIAETPPRGEELLKILPPKEQSELESAIRQTQEVLKDIEVFTPPNLDDIKGSLKGLNQISKRALEQIKK